MINWGIVGTGSIAKTFAGDLTFVPEAKLVAVGSRTLKAAEDFARLHQCEWAYDSYDGLIRDRNVAAIYVATPHALHAENMMACLNAGKAVLCEKPFTINQREATLAIAEARKNDVLLVEGMWTYFQPAFRRLIDVVKSEELGQVLSVDAELGFKGRFDPKSRLYDPYLGGGALLDMGVYNVALATALLGEPNRISAEARFCSTGVDDAVNMELHYSDNRVARLKCSIVEDTKRDATIHFEKGSIYIPAPWWHAREIHIRRENQKDEIVRFEASGYGFIPMIQEFQRCLESGLKESPVMTPAATLMNMKILDAVREKMGLRYPQDK